MAIKNVTIIGGGVLGSQIAFQSAFKGFDVTIWLRSEGSVERCKPKLERWYGIYKKELNEAKETGKPTAPGYTDNYKNVTPAECDELLEKVEKARTAVKLETDLAKSVADADLVIEALAEDLGQKRDFYETMALLLPEKTIIVSNSSTLMPSLMAQSTGRPEKFLALHFANEIWRNNLAEVMGHAGTNPELLDVLYNFALEIGMAPVKVLKEQPGYLLNSQLVPIAFAALGLVADGIASPEDVDKAWTLGTGSRTGILHFMDIVGMATVYNIGLMHPAAKDPNSSQYRINQMVKKYIDEGKLGVTAGEGFFKY